MFQLVIVEDTVKIHPSEFNKPRAEAIVVAVNAKYANKVVLDTGLCIQVYDLVSLGDAFLYPGSAAQHVTAVFRLVVFRPFVGEVMAGTIRSNSRAGIAISLEFFEDVFVPCELLFGECVFVEAENVWCWRMNGNEFFFDEKESVRFRVTEVTFNSSNTLVDQGIQGVVASGAGGTPGLGNGAAAAGASTASPVGAPGNASAPGLLAGVTGMGAHHSGSRGHLHDAGASRLPVAQKPMGQGAGLGSSGPIALAPPPMVIKAAMNEQGLGAMSWWEGDENAELGDGDSEDEEASNVEGL
mmetsp:Transcript_27387/g.73733  ORF Transcript_27387/g.73733 Transcript_27387/m.73733 type:complete len:298 (-) Transcript_27387:225-1118(-)